jgi:hypothetical protein
MQTNADYMLIRLKEISMSPHQPGRRLHWEACYNALYLRAAGIAEADVERLRRRIRE